MEHRGDQGVSVQPELREDEGDTQGVGYGRLTGGPGLPSCTRRASETAASILARSSAFPGGYSLPKVFQFLHARIPRTTLSLPARSRSTSTGRNPRSLYKPETADPLLLPYLYRQERLPGQAVFPIPAPAAGNRSRPSAPPSRAMRGSSDRQAWPATVRDEMDSPRILSVSEVLT